MHKNIRTIFVSLIVVMLLAGFSGSVSASTITWTGGGSDNLASNPSNWSGNVVPQYGDDVIFDSTSKDCIWDFDVTLASLSIKSGYSGKVTKISGITLTIAKNFVPPTAPSGLNATAISSSQIDLSWTDNSNNETGFKIERKTGVDGTYAQIATVGIDVTTYSDIGLTRGTNYYFRVRAYNSFGDSAYSNEPSATTLAVPEPTAITNPATDIGGYSTTLNATVNPNGSGTTTYFQWGIDISYGNTTLVQSIGSGTNNVSVSANLTGLSPSTSYHYRIVATNAGGTSYGSDASFTTPGWYNIDWLYRQKIISRQQVTLASSMRPNTDQTNFPVLIKIEDQTNSIFDKALSNGDDIVFTLSDGLTQLNHEIESYNNLSGSRQMVAWVKIPTLSSSSDTTIYMYYGNQDAFAQQNPTSVWDSNYKAVWHLKEDQAGTGNLGLYQDSTINNNDGNDYVDDNVSGDTDDKNGQVNGGQEFDGSDDYVTVPANPSLGVNDKNTVEVWVNTGTRTVYEIYSPSASDGTTNGIPGVMLHYIWIGIDFIPTAGINIDGTLQIISFNAPINQGQWDHLTVTYDKGVLAPENNLKTYINGNLTNSTSKSGPMYGSYFAVRIGRCPFHNDPFDGYIDELRISNVARSADWIKASYDNQRNPAGYWIFGSEESYIPPLPPTAITNTATNINNSSATLNATVNPNGSETTVFFEWGTTISYDNTTTAQSIGKGVNDVTVTATLAGLSSGTTYHYRIVATNTNGISYGDDVSFITTASATWTGGGADNLASNPANWSGNVVPQNGANVVFDNTSIKDCIWDINASPRSFTITSAYTGKVTLNLDLTIAGNLTITGGTLNLNNKNLNVDGYILIGSGGTLNATSSTITVKGDWANWGTFIPGTSTVILNGTNQTLYGNTTFYNLTKTVISADTLYFEAWSTQTILNSLTLQGIENNLLSLRSTVDGQPWYIDPQGPCNVYYIDVMDSYNINFTNIVSLNSQDSGNNTGVSFGGSECN
ncbi:MAG: hypothetical protein A2W05_00950 [Candidatus Schekmanbacteria bacterium RBG_16_38_10]|uniref:Fibronectin type-III domain-containing protein n=1 Tax=Candidatus Schekmanbacteria bacterium RBG_16_38_10 TaxID=1817879 RepID=A0A1F7S224_9BACT|nr:MAG: hypothetical protein A2W05_00950 [Candidatus Schekmanbacteria bacterium RBG_16_38_10]